MHRLPRLRRDSGSPRVAVAPCRARGWDFAPAGASPGFGFTPSKCPQKSEPGMRLSNGTCSAPVALRSHSRRKSEEPPRRAQRWRTHKWHCAFSLPHASSRCRFASQACHSGAAKQVGVAGRQAIAARLDAGSEDGQDSAVHEGVRRPHILIAGCAGSIRARGQFLLKH